MVIVEKLYKKIGRFLRRFPWLRNIFFVSGVMLNATEGFLGVKKRLSIVKGSTIVGANFRVEVEVEVDRAIDLDSAYEVNIERS